MSPFKTYLALTSLRGFLQNTSSQQSPLDESNIAFPNSLAHSQSVSVVDAMRAAGIYGRKKDLHSLTYTPSPVPTEMVQICAHIRIHTHKPSLALCVHPLIPTLPPQHSSGCPLRRTRTSACCTTARTAHTSTPPLAPGPTSHTHPIKFSLIMHPSPLSHTHPTTQPHLLSVYTPHPSFHPHPTHQQRVPSAASQNIGVLHHRTHRSHFYTAPSAWSHAARTQQPEHPRASSNPLARTESDRPPSRCVRVRVCLCAWVCVCIACCGWVYCRCANVSRSVCAGSVGAVTIR